jgi:hypothetical protein
MIPPHQLFGVFSPIPVGSHSSKSTPTSGRSTPICASSLSSATNGGVIDVTVLPSLRVKRL